MSNILKNKLMWEKYRPKDMDSLIIPDRIRNIFKNLDISKNYIFAGNFGIGKTSLARILLKNRNHLEINASLYTSIDILRNEIVEFCDRVPMIDAFSDEVIDYKDNMKYVFLEEFDRTSSQFQDALKAFVEEYDKGVRFILTTNHLNKIGEGILSRFSVINFDPITSDETKLLKIKMYNRIMEVIVPNESITIDKQTLAGLINKRFPDFRSLMNDLQHLKETGEVNHVKNDDPKTREGLYNYIYSDDASNPEKVYHYLMDNFGAEKIDVMLDMLCSNFLKWIISNKANDVSKFFKISDVVTKSLSIIESQTDPLILGISAIGQIKGILD